MTENTKADNIIFICGRYKGIDQRFIDKYVTHEYSLGDFVVSNGDLLTDIDYTELLSFLNQHDAQAVMAVKLHEWTNPFGVVEMEGLEIKGFSEKPVLRSHVNAGVYALSPAVLQMLPKGGYCDSTRPVA